MECRTHREKDWDVLGVGDADVDIFLEVDHVPGRDEKVAGSLIGEYPGGIVANFCCATSLLGNRTSILTRVGADRYGKLTLQDLEHHRVDTSIVQVCEGGTTYFCVVLLDGSGEKALTVVETDCMFPEVEDLDPDIFFRTRCVYLMAGNPDISTRVATEAKSRGALVALDLETGDAGYGLPVLRNLLASTDILFANEPAIPDLTGAAGEAGARRLLDLGPGTTVIKQGSKGCLVATQNGFWNMPSFRPPIMTDSTGAGDCFNAAFVTGHLRGWPPDRCAEFASAAAVLSLGKVGSRSALPGERDVEAFLEQQSERSSAKEH